MRRVITSRPRRRSSAIERLPELTTTNNVPSPPEKGGPQSRASSPDGGSTLITSAPSEPRSCVQVGPAYEVVTSTTRTPASGAKDIGAIIARPTGRGPEGSDARKYDPPHALPGMQRRSRRPRQVLRALRHRARRHLRIVRPPQRVRRALLHRVRNTARRARRCLAQLVHAAEARREDSRRPDGDRGGAKGDHRAVRG